MRQDDGMFASDRHKAAAATLGLTSLVPQALSEDQPADLVMMMLAS